MLKLTDILRASHVSRWNIVNVSRRQSVAEHSFNVCMIARRLCKELKMEDSNVIKAALEHDLDEVIFGDIPTPAKDKLVEEGIDINEIVGNKMRNLSKKEDAVLKTADLLDAILFLTDHAIGSHASTVLEDIKERLRIHIIGAPWESRETQGDVWEFTNNVLAEEL